MTIRNDKQRIVQPTHPGEMLREDFLPDYDLNVTSFAKALGVSRQKWHCVFLACSVIVLSFG